MKLINNDETQLQNPTNNKIIKDRDYNVSADRGEICRD